MTVPQVGRPEITTRRLATGSLGSLSLALTLKIDCAPCAPVRLSFMATGEKFVPPVLFAKVKFEKESKLGAAVVIVIVPDGVPVAVPPMSNHCVPPLLFFTKVMLSGSVIPS